VPWPATRYIAAHEIIADDDRLDRPAPPPPFEETGARVILFVPPEKGPRHVFPKFGPRWLP
jgi:hypothetical protein